MSDARRTYVAAKLSAWTATARTYRKTYIDKEDDTQPQWLQRLNLSKVMQQQ